MIFNKVCLIVFLFLYSVYSETLALQQSVKIALINAEEESTYKQRSIDSIFLRLPSYEDLADIILSADEFALSKLIQTIFLKAQDIDCQALTIYSDQVLGMIKVAVQKRTLSANQLKVIIESAKAEIQRLNREISRLEWERKSLGIQKLRDTISPMIIELQKWYDAFNRIAGGVEPKEAQIVGYQNEIKIMESRADDERQNIERHKLNIVEYSTKIKQLEQQLREFKNKKVLAEKQIEESQAEVKQIQDGINKARDIIEQLQKDIDQINRKGDELKKTYIDLEIDVERLRGDIALAVARQDAILLQIQKNQQKIQNEEQKVVERQYQNLKNMIRILNRSLPRFQNQNNELYYNCYGEGSIEEISTGNVVVYIVKGANLPIFLENNYGISRTLSITSNKDINFSLIDIFGTSWVSAYGYPFPETSLVGSDFFIVNDFTCLNPSRIKSSSGRIEAIGQNIISIVTESSQKVNLRLGACSRIESSQFLPRPGQTIYFKGIFVTKNQVNLYAASCF